MPPEPNETSSLTVATASPATQNNGEGYASPTTVIVTYGSSDFGAGDTADQVFGDEKRLSIHSISSRLGQIIAKHTGSIGMLGSMSIAVNSLAGPAMLNLPSVYARSGIIPTTATLIFVCILSSLCSLHMAKTISKVPGNSNFKKEIEFSEAFRFFKGQRWYIFTQVLFFCCVTCLNISSIVDTAQVVDTFLGHWWPFGGSAAMEIKREGVSLVLWDYSVCTEQDIQQGTCLPFDNSDGVLLTAGNLITTLIFLPMALMDLKENALGQTIGFITMVITCIQFIVQFTVSGLDWSNASLWGTNWDSLLGVILFNFCLVIVIPAWLYEREPHVDVPTVVNGSNIISTGFYVVVGLLGNLAMPNVSDNMLESMMSGAMGPFMQLGASIFAFAIIGLGSPLFSVLTRLNLTGSGLCSHRVGNVLAVYFPFGVSWVLYNGSAVTNMLSWGGVIFTSFVAFILPLTLAMFVVKEYDEYDGSIEVYFGWVKSKEAELGSLRILLVLALISVALAILGNFL